MKLAIFTYFICAFVFAKTFDINPDAASNRFYQKDSATEVREFKAYIRTFVHAVEANDTAFIKTHTIFPITNSTISRRKIDQKYFMRHLGDFFPMDLVKRIEKEGRIVVSKPTKIEKEFIVTIYDTTQGTDANYDWIFTRRQNDFYFVTFRAEVG